MDTFPLAMPIRQSRFKRGCSLVFLVFIVVGIFCIPLITGVFVERSIRNQLASINQSPFVSLSVSYYQRGWLSSVMFSRVSVPILGKTFDLSHDISHGPINFDYLTSNAPLWLLAKITSRSTSRLQPSINNQNSSPIVTTALGFNGDIALVARPHSHEPSIYDSQNSSVSTEAVSGEVHWRSSTAATNGWWQLKSATISDNAFELSLVDSSTRIYRRQLADFTGTEIQSKWKNIQYKTPDTDITSSNSWLRFSHSKDGLKATARIEGASSKLTWKNALVTDLKFDVTVRNLVDVDASAERITADSPIMQVNLENGAPSYSNLGGIHDLLQYVPPGVEIEVSDFEFYHQGRSVKGWMRGTVLNAPGNDDVEFASLLKDINLQAEVVVDESIIFDLLESRTRDVINRTEQFGAMETFSDEEAAPLVKNSVNSQLNILRQQRYLHYEDGFYSAKLSMQDGHVSINGKPLALHLFMR